MGQNPLENKESSVGSGKRNCAILPWTWITSGDSQTIFKRASVEHSDAFGERDSDGGAVGDDVHDGTLEADALHQVAVLERHEVHGVKLILLLRGQVRDGTIAAERHQRTLVDELIEQVAGQLAVVAEERRGKNSKDFHLRADEDAKVRK